MKIKDIQVGEISIPLKKPFKTALREVEVLENVVVKITTDTGNIGYGEAAITLPLQETLWALLNGL